MNYNDLLEELETGVENLIIHGQGGSGKSHLIRRFIHETNRGKLAVCTAPSGIAALNLEGRTLHGLFGFDPVVMPTGNPSKKNKELIKNINTLIIDEISMVRADLLDAVDETMRYVRQSILPFGGVRLVLVGDLFQLPPVLKTQRDRLFLEKRYGKEVRDFMFFQSFAFRDQRFSGYLKWFELSSNFRQDQDLYYAELLRQIRLGFFSEDDNEIRNLLDATLYNNLFEMMPTLTTTTKDAMTYNVAGLQMLGEQIEVFNSELEYENGFFEQDDFTAEFSDIVADEPIIPPLQVAKGAMVLFVKNDGTKRWVNGSRGEIVDIQRGTEDEKDKILVDIGGVREEVTPITVKVKIPTWSQDRKSVIAKDIGKIKQFPFVLGYGMTIHKSQGLTLEKARVDLGQGCFSSGQAYVALSRVKSIEGLSMTRSLYDTDLITNKVIREFYIRNMDTFNYIYW